MDQSHLSFNYFLVCAVLLIATVSGNMFENLAETKQREVKMKEEFEKSPVGHTLLTVLEVFSIVLLLVLVFLLIVRVVYHMK